MFAMTDDENFRNALLRAMAPLLVETGEVLIQQVLATKPTEASQTFWATSTPTGAAWALEAARHPLMVLAARSLGCAQGKSEQSVSEHQDPVPGRRLSPGNTGTNYVHVLIR